MISDKQPGIMYNKRYMLVLVLACVLRVQIFFLKLLVEIVRSAICFCSWIGAHIIYLFDIPVQLPQQEPQNDAASMIHIKQEA